MSSLAACSPNQSPEPLPHALGTPAEIRKAATRSHVTPSKNAHPAESQQHLVVLLLFPLSQTANSNHSFQKSIFCCSFSRLLLPCSDQVEPVNAPHMLSTAMPLCTAPLVTTASTATSWNPPWFQMQQVSKPRQKCAVTLLSAYCTAQLNNRTLWLSHRKQPENISVSPPASKVHSAHHSHISPSCPSQAPVPRTDCQ